MNISAEQTNKRVGVYTVSCASTSGEHVKEILSQHVETLHFQLIFSWDRLSVHVHTQQTLIVWVIGMLLTMDKCLIQYMAVTVNSSILKTISLSKETNTFTYKYILN
jgi:hypothetical protein